MSYIQRFIILIFALSIAIGSFAQKINVNIADSTNKPLSFVSANCKVDSMSDTHLTTDENGFLQISVSSGKNINLLFSRIGYSVKKIGFSLNRDTTISVVLDKVNNELATVIVTSGKKPIIEKKTDRYIVNVADNILTQGKNTTDILKRAPGMYVSGGAISMAGKTGFIVYINETPVYLSGKTLFNYLNSLPAEDILSFEVIPIPPASFDAAGNIGIIKINMRRNINPGIKGDAKLDFLQSSYPGFIGSGDISYKGKRVSILGMINGYNLTYKNITNSTYNYPSETLTNYNPKKWNYTTLGAYLSMDYQLTKTSSLSLNYQSSLFDNNKITDIQNKTTFKTTASITDSSLLSNGITDQKTNQQNVDILYIKKLKKPGAIFKFNAAYLRNSSNSRRPFTSTTILSDSLLNSDSSMTTAELTSNIYTSKADMVIPSKFININFGGKVSFIHNISTNNSFTKTDNSYVVDSTQMNTFNYKENTQSLYLSLDKRIGKWAFKGGIRTEVTQTLSLSLKRTYTKFFPTFFTSFNLNEKNNFSFSYAERVGRPPFEYLNPFKWYINKYFYATGNPFLTPAYSHIAELGYLYDNTFNVKLSFVRQNNMFGRIVLLDSNNINSQIQKTDNFYNKTNYSINFYKYYDKLKWVEVIGQANISYENYISKNNSLPNKSGLGCIFSLSNTIYLTKQKNSQFLINVQENLPGFYDYRDKTNSFNLDIGFTYVFPNKKFETNIYASDILKTAAPQYSYSTQRVSQSYNNYYDSRQLQLTIKYKFGNKFIKRITEQQSPSNEDEKNRVK